ncbi:MAG: hypothetical protein J6K87_00885 [Clostridia bacterium]|nr:hypothetical protein [Clostridia bacterium]
MFNFKKPLAFITGVICSTVCLHHCSALERNELGIITALTKDATIEEKIDEVRMACSEYLNRLNADPDLVKELMKHGYGAIMSHDKEITSPYDEITKGNFGLEWPLMDYVLTLLEKAGFKVARFCCCKGESVPRISVKETNNIDYNRLVTVAGKYCYIFDFCRSDSRLGLYFGIGCLEKKNK